MSGSYSPVPRSTANAISLDSPAPSRRSLDSSSDGSDIVYRDALDDEPFDEKGSALRFDAEGRMEDGDDGAGYPVEPRRVSEHEYTRTRSGREALIQVLMVWLAEAAEEIPQGPRHPHWDRRLRCDHRCPRRDGVFRTELLCKEREQTHYDGPYLQRDVWGRVKVARMGQGG
jgi:hypothetical protein